MNIFELIKKESVDKRRDILLAAAISGVSNAAILGIINKAAAHASENNVNFRFFLMFLLAFALYFLCLHYTFNKSNEILESIICKLRTRISKKIDHAELGDLERIGKGLIYNRLVQETTIISESQGLLSAALQSSIMVIFTSLYMALLSIPAFIITIILVVGAVAIYLSKQKRINRLEEATSQKQIKLFGLVSDLLDGFKQIKMNPKRGSALQKDIRMVAEDLREARVHTSSLNNANYIFSQAFFYFLIAVIVFLLPRLITTYSDVVQELTASVLFIVSPLTVVVAAIPVMSRINLSAKNIAHLETLLDHHTIEPTEDSHSHGRGAFYPFKHINLKDVTFSYKNNLGNGFTVGPLSFSIKARETLFIIGGNGSGKSTLLKLLTGLYQPERGHIRVDDTRVNKGELTEYREMFSVIFGDFYLFHKLYGLEDVSVENVLFYLKQMDIDKRISYDGTRFSDLELSTGQRKRLAMVVARLENRPIYIFDEWAADQDPEFRKFFYHDLLKELKQENKTVIAVTHDDHYFKMADRILKLDYGQIELLDKPEKFQFFQKETLKTNPPIKD